MKRLADENLDLSVVARLREAGHQVLAVAEMEPGTRTLASWRSASLWFITE